MLRSKSLTPTMERDEKGRRLLKEHPLRGIELPREKKPEGLLVSR